MPRCPHCSVEVPEGSRFPTTCDLYEFRGDKILNKDTYWKRVEQDGRL